MKLKPIEQNENQPVKLTLTLDTHTVITGMSVKTDVKMGGDQTHQKRIILNNLRRI